jgi:hypothetical protein
LVFLTQEPKVSDAAPDAQRQCQLGLDVALVETHLAMERHVVAVNRARWRVLSLSLSLLNIFASSPPPAPSSAQDMHVRGRK